MMFSYKYWVKEEPETDQRGGCVINLFIYSLTEILLSSTPTLEDIVLSLRELTGRRVKRFKKNEISVKRKKKYTYAYRFLGTQTHTKKGKTREESYRTRSKFYPLLPQRRNILRVGRPLFLQN